MNLWIRRLHMYTGLFNFSLLIVFGLAGLVVTADAPDIFAPGNQPAVSTQTFTAPPSASDKEVGQLIAKSLAPPNSGPPYVHRDGSHQLVADFYGPDGLVRATLIEPSNQLRVQTYRNSIWRFFDNVHATTIRDKSTSPVIRAWAWYIECGIWSLIFMTLSGVWLGVRVRWEFSWTRVALAAGVIVFAALYWMER